MKINQLEISNFRGIKECNISFPEEKRIICLIGPGDSTKSTILKAIDWVLWPSWNLTVCDSDFYMCNVSEPIVIRGTFSEIPETLLTTDKYGFYLRRKYAKFGVDIDDEPLENSEISNACITIQLTIDSSLEPRWEVVCNRNEPKIISCTDRKNLSVGNVGEDCSQDLTWNKFSVLQKYENSKTIINNANIETWRSVINETKLCELDKISATIVQVGEEYGVGFDNEILNKFLIQGNFKNSPIGLFDGNVPLMQRGNGSKRLLSMGLNINVSKANSMLLIDELENGLEPYRLRSLINELRGKYKESGQVIMTTHSPVAVAECDIEELMIVRSNCGITNAIDFCNQDIKLNENLQAQVRTNPESFLCKRLIVCEGKTEIGFVRAIDKYLSKIKHCRMAFKGVGCAYGSGQNIFKYAQTFYDCGYEICLFMDSDKDEDKEAKENMIEKGIKIFDWDNSNSIEEQIFNDCNIKIINELLKIAVDYKGLENIKSTLDKNQIEFTVNNENIEILDLKNFEFKRIGNIAKTKKESWYKRIDLGEKIGDVIFENFSLIDDDSRLKTTIDNLLNWVMENDRS